MSNKTSGSINFMKKSIKISDLLIIIYIVLCLITYIGTWYNISTYNYFNSVLSVLLLVLNIIIFIIFIPKSIFKELDFVIIGLILTLVLSNAILANSGIGGISVIVNCILMLSIFKYISIPKKMIKLSSFVMLIFFVYYIFNFDSRFNPNTIAYTILISSIYCCLFFSTIKRKYLVFVPLILWMAYSSIIYTESRTSLVGLFIFIFFSYLLPKKIFSNKTFFTSVYLILTIGSVLFTYAYVQMWKSKFNFELSFSDKSLYSGRQLIWDEILNAFSTSPITGIGTNYHITSFVSLSIHNSMLNIMAIYGILVFFLFVYLLYKRLMDLLPLAAENQIVKLSLAGFITILSMGFFENNLLYYPMLFPTLFLILIGYSVYHEDKI